MGLVAMKNRYWATSVVLAALSSVVVPAWAQSTADTGTQSYWSDKTGKGATSGGSSTWSDVYPEPTSTDLMTPGSVNPGPIGSQSFHLGFPDLKNDMYTGAYRGGMPGGVTPYTATSSVDIDCVDMVPRQCSSSGGGGENYGYNGGGGSEGGGGGEQLPPPPGEGYSPIYQHGVFVGYMSPAIQQQMQTDPAGAWTAFANSSDYVGPEGLRLSLLAETGGLSPEQQAQFNAMLWGF